MKKIKDDTTKWENVPWSLIERTNMVKMSILSKGIYTFNAVPVKVVQAFSTELEQTILKFVRKHKRPWIPKQSWKWKAKLKASKFWAYFTNLESSRQWYWQKNRCIDEWNRKPRNEPTAIWSTPPQQSRKEYPMEKVFSANGVGENWIAICKRMKLNHFLILYININLKWKKDLNGRYETTKILEKNTSRTSLTSAITASY